MVSMLTTSVNDDLEHILMLRVRNGNNGIIGLYLKDETKNAIKNMKKEIKTKFITI